MISRGTLRGAALWPGPGRFAAAGAALAAVVAVAAMFCSCSREPRRLPDAAIVVAEVDNVPVSLRDVKSEILALRGYSPTLEERGAGRAEVSEAVRILTERTIVLREGARRGITVSFASLEEEVMRYRTDFPEGGMEKALLQVGMSEDEWRERLRKSILYRKSAEAIASGLVSVAPRDVEEAFRMEGVAAGHPERIRVRQFLFESATEAVEARERLLQGGIPGRSRDSAGKGVDLGFFSRDELPPELPPDLFRMKEGGVSEPVFLEGSVSLFLVEEKQAARAKTLESEEKRIRESLLSARRETAFRLWLAQACTTATVKMRAELLEKLVEGKR